VVVSPLGAVSATSRTPALLVVGEVVAVREAIALRASAA
jgi:siroheme synthase